MNRRLPSVLLAVVGSLMVGSAVSSSGVVLRRSFDAWTRETFLFVPRRTK